MGGFSGMKRKKFSPQRISVLKQNEEMVAIEKKEAGSKKGEAL